MRRIVLISLFSTIILLSAGCKKIIDPELDYSPRSYISEAEGGTFIFNIECNTTWTIEDYGSTITATITPLEGEGNDVVTVVIPENKTGATEQVKFKITAQGTEEYVVDYATITINPALFVWVDNSKIELPAAGGGRLVHVTANKPWSANGVTVTKSGSNTSWCNITYLESQSNLELNISADANKSGQTRYATFTLSLDEYPNVNCVIEVSQESL